MQKKFIIVETTYPKITAAKNLAKILLEQKLAACVHFFPIKTTYFWEEKIESGNEILVRIKTKNSLFQKIKKTILHNHTYKNPQIISTQMDQGSKAYFDWINSATKDGK